jgi:protein capL
MKSIAIIGLGYVGLPLAYHLAKKGNKIIGFDISEQKLSELKNGFDSTEEI